MVIWFLGFVIYRILMQVDVIVGSTFLDVVITILIFLGVSLFQKTKTEEKTI